jgi:hypothetical protein
MRLFPFCAALVFAGAVFAQPVDPQLAAAIAKIRAIDNHAHPVRALAPGEKDDEVDALPVEVMEPSPEPYRTRAENPEVIRAWTSLFDYHYPDRSPEHVRVLRERKKQFQHDKSDGYPAFILDRLGIEVMFANRVALGRGIAPPRFRWVPFVDALMYPLDNRKLSARTPDHKTYYADEDRLLTRYLRESGYTQPPHDLDEYLAKVVTATLERHKQSGAIAEKFEAAYLRSLDFSDPPREEAARVYASGGVPSNADYKKLQDFLFRYIAAECGRLGLPVHLHAAAGAGGYFEVGGANPLLLESVVNDPALRKTSFVLIHGGWPFTREVAALLTKPNVWADFSEQTFMTYPHSVAAVIREWLEYVPEKVLFATDAYPFSQDMDWEESAWVATTTGRQALGMALTGMLHDNEITRARALELARMVLRDNARKLYNLP